MAEFKVRLCGGPFDGDKAGIRELPPALWVEHCPRCGTHWYSEPGGRCEKYRQDGEKGNVTIYVYEDSNLSGGGGLEASDTRPRERIKGAPEKVPA